MKRCVLLAIISLFLLLWATQSLPGSGRSRAQNTKSAAMTSADCVGCHDNADLTRDLAGKPASFQVSRARFADSVHGLLDCSSCHSDVNTVPHASPAKVDCGSCHQDASAAYNKGLHAKAIQSGNIKAATCVDCHGEAHAIQRSSDPRSTVNHANIAATCGSCHGEKFVMEGSGLTTRPFLSYQESVHGRAVASGNAKAAACTDCHGSHDIRPPTDAQSAIARFNVPRTCGQCHGDIATEFGRSIHGQSLARGNWQAPVCTDCHGIHLIKSHIDPTSSVAAQALAKTTCAQCHEGVRLAQEFDVLGKRSSSYMDSYHGLASKLGSGVIANCASCHGIHNILPSSDTNSMVHSGNLVQTCGKCHAGASENFILGKIHLDVPTSQDIGSVATRWVRWIYLSLITLVIGGMLIHNGLVWRKKAVLRRKADRPIVRMTTNQRVQHLLLLTSFFFLVFTGFALKYPDSWLGVLLGSSESFRRIGHRIAAVVMIGVGLYHVAYMLGTREGRQGLKDFLPKPKDLLDLFQNVRYYLGRSISPAKIGRFGYAEKAEYWAVIWGTLLMGLTGLMIWFKVEMFSFLPRWSIDIALAIHFYEAILATLAIVVWHFYHVIFDPDVYPMSWAWLDGRVSEESFKEEHALAYEDMKRVSQPDADVQNQGGGSGPAKAGDSKPSTAD
ncbi:MAG: cytochrome b/b6 domain-containing protein [Blastocatellia bacterium]